MDKMRIAGFKEHPKSMTGGGESAIYTVKTNPEKFNFKRKLSFNQENAANTGRDIFQFGGYDADRLNFDLVLDGTGVATDVQYNVHDEIVELNEVLYDYHGEKHKPYFLRIEWGAFRFICHLDSMSIEYTLFKSDGNPLRAKVSLAFLEATDPKAVEISAYKQSPDVTHIETFKAGDSLFEKCQEIYGDPRYYILVAQHNQLYNFRNIPEGKRIIFPPIAK